MKRSVIETVLGGVVLLVAAVFFVFAYTSSDIEPVKGYTGPPGLIRSMDW